jgi:hypothetical protein
MPNGQYFATGGYNVIGNVIFTSVYDTTTRSWVSTPSLPTVTIGASTYPLTAEDHGAVVLTDGNLLLGTSAKHQGDIFYIEWDGTSYCQVKNVPTGMPGQPEMLTLPTGQVLITGVSWGGPTAYFIYTPGGTQYPGIQPEITTYPATIDRGVVYKIDGFQFNGATQSSFFGDDFQNATNYPLVRITNTMTSEVYYAKTHNPSTMAVATGALATFTYFEVPAAAPTGASLLEVVANGIASKPVPVTVNP